MNHPVNTLRYSFVVPIYNDGYFVESFCEAINQEMNNLLELTDISKELKSYL